LCSRAPEMRIWSPGDINARLIVRGRTGVPTPWAGLQWASMPRYAAFLRAINLGSRRRVSGAELRERFEGLGFAQVSTFRTSGNVAFMAGREASRAVLVGQIAARLEQAFGYPVGVFLRTTDEVREIAAHRPFDETLIARSNGKLQVALLGPKPRATVERHVLKLAGDDDRLAFAGRELYWLPSAGTQESALDWKEIERVLGPMTMRTKGTVEALATTYFG
jgi:uncharacterized protein (DUF1697 family)